MRTIYRIWLSALKREGKFFFANKETAEAYAIKLVKHYGGFYKLIEYYDNGTIECEDE